MVVADKISIRVHELDFWNIWMNSSLRKYDEKIFWNLYSMYEHMLTDSETEPYTVVDEYVEEYKERLISHLVKEYLKSEGTRSYSNDIRINQKEKKLKWKKFKIHKKSDTKYIGKSKDGLSFKIRFDVDEDVELDSQIKKFIEVDILNDFIRTVDNQFPCSSEHFTSLLKEQKIERIASLLLLGCYLGYLDELDYDCADDLLELIDRCYKDEDWKRGISIARDFGSMTGYGYIMTDEYPDHPLHPMFIR
jgi:hypothetical protein